MRHILWGTVLVVAALTSFDVEGWVNSPYYYYEWNILADLELSAGYRQDNLHWSIADPSGTPNILSELQWKNIQISQVKAQSHVLLLDVVYLRGSADYGRIFHGCNQDSDYAGNGKTMEFSRSKATSNQGEVFDFSGAIGWLFTFPLCDSELKVVPLIGYSYSEQHFRDRNGKLLVNSGFTALGDELPLGGLGSFPGLHSNYRARWKGAWLGVDLFLPVSCEIELFGTFEYHRVKYHGTGHWNLRTDFVSDFQQKANHGHGIYASGGFKYAFCENYYAGCSGSYTWMNSHRGTDTTFFVLGPETTGFNGATWHSWCLMANMGLLF